MSNLIDIQATIDALEKVAELSREDTTSDCISRQAAIDAVHKNYDTILDFKSDGRTMAYSFKDIINALPSAQPDIIYCKDCRHNGSFDTDCPIDWNGKEYCSFAER